MYMNIVVDDLLCIIIIIIIAYFEFLNLFAVHIKAGPVQGRQR